VPPPGPAAAGLQENVASALCYVLGFITGIIFLVLEPYNKNRVVRFHAFQSIFFSVGVFVLNIILSTLLFGALFGVGLFSAVLLVYRLIQLVFFLGWLFLIWKAYSNEKFMIPVIGPLAEKQANS
jgi:uncharacterized membrane protein